MILDVIVLVILLISAFIGYKKGLVGIAISLISLILSIILAVLLQGNLANYLFSETTIGDTIEGSVKTMLEAQIENNTKEDTFINMFFDTDELINEMVDENAKKVTMFILKGISFIGIFILVSIICYIIRMILNIVFKLPILNSINKFGGVSLNVIKTIFKIWILLAIISFISFMPTIEHITKIIDSSIITKLLYENNIIINILKNTLGL